MRALFVLSLVAGCAGHAKCKPGTLFITIDGAQGADSLYVQIEVDSRPATATFPLNGRSGGSVEVDFDSYQTGATVAWTVTALVSGFDVADKSGSFVLAPGCDTLSVMLYPALDLAGAHDLAGVDAAMSCDRPCTGPCESCFGGLCTFINTPFNCTGLSTVCAGTCDGQHSDCNYPTGVCSAPRCGGGSAYGQGTCNQGVCTAPSPTACNPAVCGATACAQVVEVAAAGSTACALINDGTVSCWGDNQYGQTGVSPSPAVLLTVGIPTRVAGLTGITHISHGGGWGCAVMSDKTVKCWGSNALGFLGIGTTDSNFHPPTTVLTGVGTVLSNVSAIYSSNDYTCAVTGANTAYCWGYTEGATSGLQNQPGTSALYATPVCARESASQSCAAANDVAQVAPATGHACYVAIGGAVACWGNNVNGDCGQPSGAVLLPKTIAGLNASRVAAGQGVSCAVKSDASAQLLCWGDNSDGMLGLGGTDTNAHPSPSPVCVDAGCTQTLGSIAWVAIGGHHVCALQNALPVCWGRNPHGQLLTGDRNDRFYAPNPSGGAGPSQLSSGDQFTCSASQAAGTAYCWGADDKFQIGDDDHADKLTKTAPNLGAGL
jgi:alpha-tubulin suppressor-like RCC1 family protein